MKPNIALFESMIKRYLFLSVTSHFIFGFFYQKTVYVVHADSNILPFVLKLDKASRGAGYSLRFSPTTAQKVLLLSQGAIPLCSEKEHKSCIRKYKLFPDRIRNLTGISNIKYSRNEVEQQ